MLAILGGNIDPRKREDWILRRVNTIDALICNPWLVETGLNLVLFSTVVYFEIEYSLYTLWQSLRRVWRLGQSQPIKAVFSINSSTMESKALSLIGRKMKRAQLLFGDEGGGAIIPEKGGDFVTQLARDVLNGTWLTDLQTLFANEMQVSNSPLGSPTETSPLMVPVLLASQTWEEWLKEHYG
jgi:hypothetical protein